MKTFSLIFLFFVLNFSYAFSKEEIKLDEDSPINVRLADEKAFEKYQNDKEFDYSREIPQKQVTLWDRIWNWIAKMIFELIGKSIEVPQIRYAFIIIILSIVVFLLLKTDALKLFVSNRKRAKIDYETEKEDIRKLNIDEIISQAIKNKNFRKAVRYLYLKLLKELDNRELINWEINKTNRDYSNELKKSELKKEFKELSVYYEYVWYGDFEINQTMFENINKQFKNSYKSFSI